MNATYALALLAALLAPVPLLAQDAGDSEQARINAEMCATTKCQRNLRIALTDENGASYDQTFEVFPAVVQPFGFLVVAGQTVHIEAEIVDGKLQNLVAVDAVANPEKTISATLEQTEDGGMMLSVSNPFQEMLKFRIGMMPMGQDDLYATSSCPIIPGGAIFEMWPFPIFQVAVGDGQVLDEGSPMVCAE